MAPRRAPQRTPRRGRPVLTGRALVLGALVVLLVVVLASPVNRYLASRKSVSNSAQQLHDDRAQQAALAKEKALYGDPGYIQAQARIRLQYAMPGDTVYVVVDKGQRSDIERTRAQPGDTRAAGAAWTDRLWNSVRDADK